MKNIYLILKIVLMNYLIDIIVCTLLILGFYRGFKKGFFDEISYLLSLVFSIYGAIHFSYHLKVVLDKQFVLDYKYSTLIAFFGMLIIVVLGMALISKIFDKMEGLVNLGVASKYLGGLLASAKLILLLGIAFTWLESVSFMLPVFNKQ
ncbi:CvpA family protein [Wenyingzhuangia sp. IMCC45533]